MTRRLPLILFLLLLVLPTLELAVILMVGRQIGVPWTLGMLVAESLLGAWIVGREGKRAWRALRDALQTATMPSGQLADAALVLFGGTLLLTPGFVTDAAGFFCVIPFTRPFARRVLTKAVESRLLGATSMRSAATSTGTYSTYSPGSSADGPGMRFGGPGSSSGGSDSSMGGPNTSTGHDTTDHPRTIPGDIVDDTPPRTN